MGWQDHLVDQFLPRGAEFDGHYRSTVSGGLRSLERSSGVSVTFPLRILLSRHVVEELGRVER